MPSIEFSSPSVNFGVCGPGPQPSQYVTLTVSTAQPLPFTIELASATNSGFVATVCSSVTAPSIHGSPVTTTTNIASTSSSVAPASGTLTATPTTSTNIHTLLRIDFTPPATPLPLAWSGMVTISWSGGSAELQLSGTTAQLGLKITSAQPTPVTPGQTATVAITVEYDSVDAATISVDLGPSTNSLYPEIAELTIPSKTLSMPATYIAGTDSPPNKGLGSTTVVKTGVGAPTLNVHRTATLELPVSAGVTAEPGNNQLAYIVLSAPSLPEEIAGPFYYKALFNVAALPVKITPPAGTINLLAGTSASVILAVEEPGAQTSLEFGSATLSYGTSIPGGKVMSGSPNVTVTTGSFNIGHNSGNSATFKLSAPASALGAVVNISAPWTAYKGMLKGTVSFQVNLLPQSIQLNGSANYAKLTGSYAWNLNASGYSYFTGNVHVPVSEILSQSYACGVSLSAENSQKKPLAVMHSGTIGNPITGVVGDTSSSWNDAGRWNGSAPQTWMNSSNPATILAAWAQICGATRKESSNYSPDAVGTVIGILTGVTPVEGVVAGIIIAVEGGISCLWTAATDSDADGDDFGAGSLNCSGGDDPDGDPGEGGAGGAGGAGGEEGG